jgi:hypothetical protein
VIVANGGVTESSGLIVLYWPVLRSGSPMPIADAKTRSC